MQAELMTVTPDWARQILREKNTQNRAMNYRHVAKLADEIRSGRWKVNGDTICISGDILIDGQHRLAAIASCNIAVQSFVVIGLNPDVFDTKDAGKRRSPGDTLGVRGEKNAYRMASALVLVDKYITGRADKSVEYTNTEIEELLKKYPDIRESLQVSAKCKGIIQPSVLDACYYLFSQKDKSLAMDFVNKVIRGTGLEDGDPFHMLRERLFKNSISKAKLPKHYIMALCIKAWNSTRRGMKIRSLRWRETGEATESFPVAI